MSSFFDGTRPGRRMTCGRATFELPVLYFRDDAFALFFTADLEQVRALMPSDRLRPVRLPGKRTLLGVVAFNYIDTSIGPYGEVGVVVPAVFGAPGLVPVLPGLLESRYPGFGMVVLHLPVTTVTARDGGRGMWGYTKFLADMAFDYGPEYLRCRLSEGDEHILTLQVARLGRVLQDESPIVTYSVGDGNLIRTVIPQRGTYRMALRPRRSFLQLGQHPVARSLAELGLSERPVQSRYFLERCAILPEGEVVEMGVRPLDGFLGTDREGHHTLVYGNFEHDRPAV